MVQAAHFPCAALVKAAQGAVVAKPRANPMASYTWSILTGIAAREVHVFQTLVCPAYVPGSSKWHCKVFLILSFNDHQVFWDECLPRSGSALAYWSFLSRTIWAVFCNPRKSIPLLWKAWPLSLVHCPWNLFCFCPLLVYWTDVFLIHMRENLIKVIKNNSSLKHFFSLMEWGHSKEGCFGGKTKDLCWDG